MRWGYFRGTERTDPKRGQHRGPGTQRFRNVRIF
jgi:hypothetical protein